MNIHDFLAARFSEEAAAAEHDVPPRTQGDLSQFEVEEVIEGAAQAWEARKRLADADAKRRIVKRHHPRPQVANAQLLTDAERCAECRSGTWPCATLRLLALPYVGHEDYSESWRP